MGQLRGSAEARAQEEPCGLIFNIQRFSVHDGPGIRTTVFFQGCNLRCYWCHNPEGVDRSPQPQLYPELCLGCGACVAACPNGAMVSEGGKPRFVRWRCRGCGACTRVCFAGARVIAAREMGVAEVMREIVADRSFYQSSGGGVTLSGGEPLAQPEFCGALLWAIKAEGLHAAIETAGNVAWSVLEAVLPHLDLVMMDIKHMDPEKHREATGVTNTLVIENATRLAAGGVPLVFRTPVIPGFNDTEEALGAIARFVRTLIVRRMSIGTEGTGGTAPIAYELLPHHPLAGDKYHSLGKENRAAGLSVMAEAEMERLREHVARIVQSREEGRVG